MIKRKPIRKWTEWRFILQLKNNPSILDVGCGNNSPDRVKQWRSDVYYVGVDVGDYNNSNDSINKADEYIISDSNSFHETIRSIPKQFDAVVSCHNIEHCNHPIETLNAMCSKLKLGGRLYLSFPCEESVNFPRGRFGTLNFYDDPTHIWLPDFDKIIHILENNGLEIIYKTKKYRPISYVLMGLFNEPLSIIKKRVLKGTWALRGFESIIWARKPE